MICKNKCDLEDTKCKKYANGSGSFLSCCSSKSLINYSHHLIFCNLEDNKCKKYNLELRLNFSVRHENPRINLMQIIFRQCQGRCVHSHHLSSPYIPLMPFSKNGLLFKKLSLHPCDHQSLGQSSIKPIRSVHDFLRHNK